MTGPRAVGGWWVGATPAPTDDAPGVLVEPVRDRFGQVIGRARADYRLACRVMRDPARSRRAGRAASLALGPGVLDELVVLAREGFASLFERALYANDAELDARVTRARAALLAAESLLATLNEGEVAG